MQIVLLRSRGTRYGSTPYRRPHPNSTHCAVGVGTATRKSLAASRSSHAASSARHASTPTISPPASERSISLKLPRFGGHPKTRDNAQGVSHGETKSTKEVQSGVQGKGGSTVPRGEPEHHAGCSGPRLDRVGVTQLVEASRRRCWQWAS